MNRRDLPLSGCPLDYAAMDGPVERRHCAQCDQFVTNLSALTEDEARRRIAAGPGCVRYRFRSDGTILFRPAVVAASLGLAATAAASPMVRPPEAPPEQPPPTEVTEAEADEATEAAPRRAPATLRIFDDYGLPLVGPVKLTGPDGHTVQLKLDESGKARFDPKKHWKPDARGRFSLTLEVYHTEVDAVLTGPGPDYRMTFSDPSDWGATMGVMIE